jgi:hypothetical protein
MKKFKVLVAAMFILSIVGIKTAMAQYRTPARTYTGTAFLRPEFEYQKNPITISKNFSDALINAFEKGILTCFTRDANQTPNKPPQQIVRDMLDHLRTQGNRPDLTGIEAAQLIRYHTIYKTVGSDYWLTHESAYIDSKTGAIMWWNPLNSSLFRDRKEWVIACVDVNGVIVEFIANCGNLCRLKQGDSNPNEGLEQFPSPNERQYPSGPTYTPPAPEGCKITFSAHPYTIYAGSSSTLSWVSNGNDCGVTVDIEGVGTNLPSTGNQVVFPRQTTVYTLTTLAGQHVTATVIVLKNLMAVRTNDGPSFFASNWGYFAAGAVVGTVLAVTHPWDTHHSAPVIVPPKDNTYNNGFQGGSGSTTTTGGTGSQQPFYATPPIVSPMPAVTTAPVMVGRPNRTIFTISHTFYFK